MGKKATTALHTVQKDAPEEMETINKLKLAIVASVQAEAQANQLAINIQDRLRLGAETTAKEISDRAKEWAEVQRKSIEELDKSLDAYYAKGNKEADKALEEQLGWEGKKQAAADATAKAQVEGDNEVRKSREALALAELKSGSSGARNDIANQAKLGIISKLDEARQIAALDEDELKQARAIHQKELGELQQHLKDMQVAQATAKGGPDEAGAIRATAAAQVALNAENTKFIALQTQLQGVIKANETEAAKLDSSWHNYFTKMGTDTKNLGMQIRTNLQANIDHAVSSFSSGFAKMIVEGQSLGKEMAQLGKEIAESFISMLTEIAIEWVLSNIFKGKTDQVTSLGLITDAAAVAGAQGTASFAGAPWPVDMGAPGFGETMMGTAMGYADMLAHAERGAYLDAPIGTPVPIMAHGKELVLPAGISQGLTAMIGRNGIGGQRPINVNMKVTTPGVDGFKQSAGQTTAKYYREISRVSARNG